MKMPFDLDDEPVKHGPAPTQVEGTESQAATSIIDSSNLAIEENYADERLWPTTPTSTNDFPAGNENEPDEEVITVLDEPIAPPPAAVPLNKVSLPQGMSDRPVTATMKRRYEGHAPVNDQVRADWMKVIEQDRFSYDALLYRPVVPVPTALDDDGIETPLFTELNNNQAELDYQEPVMVTVLDSSDQRETFTAIDSDGNQDGLVDDFLVMRAATRDVSIGSIFEWNEEGMAGESIRRWWYVLRIYSYGTASVGSLYYCIPCRNLENSAEVVQRVQQ